MKDSLKELKDLFSFPKEITIISHRNPDGDALGSSLALSLFLQKSGHNVKVVFPSDYPESFSYLKDIEKSIIFDTDQNAARQAVDKADIIICADFNGLDRIDKLGENVQFSKAKKVLIDHHLDPEPFTDIEYWDTESSSTCELVFKLLEDLGDKNKIDSDIGCCILTGIITDTGSFRYGTRVETYRVAGDLKALGVDDHYVQDRIYNSMTEKKLRLLGHCLANRLEIIKEYGVGIIHLTRKDYSEFDIQRGDTEGIVNYLLMIPEIVVAAFVTEQPSIVKLSLRSKGDISVQEIATKYFNGGGHKNASGGGVYASLADILDKLKRVIPHHLPKVS
ncbi:MAG: bifunctional oligoribonuclease/PAP phosphatase NrnA [Saprospiraceae bacterium]|nr:bifunctional oligoribonuclease/PAP phosphatase NrnA [Saprospiraceae bacterium]